MNFFLYLYILHSCNEHYADISLLVKYGRLHNWFKWFNLFQLFFELPFKFLHQPNQWSDSCLLVRCWNSCCGRKPMRITIPSLSDGLVVSCTLVNKSIIAAQVLSCKWLLPNPSAGQYLITRLLPNYGSILHRETAETRAHPSINFDCHETRRLLYGLWLYMWTLSLPMYMWTPFFHVKLL